MPNAKLGGDLFLLALELKQLAPLVVGKARFRMILPVETLEALRENLEPHLIRDTQDGFCAQGFYFSAMDT